MEVVVEIIEPGRRAPSIKRFDQSEILVGRGWDADLVIADNEVDAHHAQIVFDDETDTVQISDLDSANGVRVKRRRIVGMEKIRFGESILIGQTAFRLHRVTDAIAPTIVRSAAEKLLQQLGHPGLAITIALIAVCLQEYFTFVGLGVRFEWENRLSSLLSFTTSLGAWALIWGAITKLLKHQMRIWTHLSLASIIWITYLLLTEFSVFISFNLLSSRAAQIVDAAIFSAMLFAWVSLGLIITSHLRIRARSAVASGLVVLFLMTSFVLPYVETQSRVFIAALETKIMSPSLLIRKAESPEDFMEKVNMTINRTEQTAQRANQEATKTASATSD